MRSELKALHERLPNLTIVCVTHDQDDALVLSDRTLLMRDGHIAQLGTPQELYDTPNDAYVARYLGAANLLPPGVAFPVGDAQAFRTQAGELVAHVVARIAARYLGAANLLPPQVAFALGDARHTVRDRVALLRPESMRIVPLGEGQLHGTIASVEWYGAVLSVSVVLDAMPDQPVLVTTQRGHGMMPEKGARISLQYEADDVVLINP